MKQKMKKGLNVFMSQSKLELLFKGSMYVLVCFFFIGCGENLEQSFQLPNEKRVNPPFEEPQKYLSLWGKFKDACDAAGGQWKDGLRSSCSCPGNSVFAWTQSNSVCAQFEPALHAVNKTIRALTACIEKKDCSNVEEPSWLGHYTIDPSRRDMPSMDVSISWDPNKLAVSEAVWILQILDDLLISSEDNIFSRKIFFNTQRTGFIFSLHPNDLVIENEITQSQHYKQRPTYDFGLVDFMSNYVILSNEHSSDEMISDNQINDCNEAISPEVQQLVKDAMTLRENRIQDSLWHFTEESLNNKPQFALAFTEHFYLDENYTLSGKREYCYGHPCHEYWYVRHTNGDTKAILRFGGGGDTPDWVMILTYSLTLEHGAQSIVYMTDEKLKHAAVTRYTLPVHNLLDELTSYHQSEKKAVVGMLESVFLDRLTSQERKKLVKGPFVVNLGEERDFTGGSILGWFPNQNFSWTKYMAGIFNTKIGVPTVEAISGISGQFSEHSQYVQEAIATHYPDVYIAPLGTNILFDHFDEFASNQNRISVLLSVGDNCIHNKTVCRSKFEAILSPAGQKFLWVFAAGNGYKTTCFDAIQNAVNVLFVGGYSKILNEWLPILEQDPVSLDYDSYFTPSAFSVSMYQDADVEIRNETSGKIHIGQGTSFAAPRVAARAAQLFNENPSLTPMQIKKLLLKETVTRIRSDSGVSVPWLPTPDISGIIDLCWSKERCYNEAD